MGIKEDFQNYTDSNNLNTPAPCIPVPRKGGSDNGNMFTSEYYLMLSKNNQLNNQDKIDYSDKIKQCISFNLLNRVPIGQNDGINGPDDYYGVMNGCIELGNIDIPRKLLWGCVKHLGFMNNVSPGTWTARSFLIRQPQLLCAMINASFPSFKNPSHMLIRLLSFPLYLISAIVILISCTGTPIDQADPRRLAWHLQNNLKKTSLLCYFASKIWVKRLYKHYFNGMKDVAGIYYQPDGLNQNPYSKWWKD
jgi:hypothetical protein